MSASGQLGPQIDLFPGGGGLSPQLAMAPSGRAFAAWQSDLNFESTVYGRWVERDGTLGPLLTLQAPEPGKINPVEVHVAVDPAGVATVVWRNDTGGNANIGLRRVQPDSTVGPVVPKLGEGTGIQVADLPNGSTVVAWRSSGTEINTVTSDLTVGTPALISSNNKTANPDIGVDSQGNGLVAWREGNAPPFTLRGVRFDPSGTPFGGEILIDPTAPASIGSRMSISTDTAGDFLVAWVRLAQDEGVVYTRGIDSTGEFKGPPEPISGPEIAEELLGSAIDDRGNGAVAWPTFTEAPDDRTVLGREIDSAGLPAGSGGILSAPRAQGGIAVGSAPALGFAAFLTRQGDNIVVRRFLEPPTCRDLAATVIQGRPISVPISCRGPGIDGALAGAPGYGEVGPLDPASLSFRYAPKPGFNGTDRFTYTARNDGGSSNSALVTIIVGRDTVKPRIRRFRFVRNKPDKFVLKLSEPARVAITVDAPAGGGAKPSKRSVAGRVKSRKAARNVVIQFPGRLAKKLDAGGRFRATAVATDPAKNRSKPKRLRISIAPAR